MYSKLNNNLYPNHLHIPLYQIKQENHWCQEHIYLLVNLIHLITTVFFLYLTLFLYTPILFILYILKSTVAIYAHSKKIIRGVSERNTP